MDAGSGLASGLLKALGIGGVRDHDEGQRAMQFAIGKHVLFPKLFPCAVDGGSGVVRVERAAAEAGEVLAAAERTGPAEAGEEGFRVGDDAFRIAGDDTRAHHFIGSGGAQIEHGRERNVEAEQAKLGTDEIAMLAIEFSVARRRNCRRRGHWSNQVTKAIDESAFDVDCMEEGTVADQTFDALEQCVDLDSFFDVAAEEDGAGGPDQAQPGALGGIEFRSGKTDKQ